MVSDGIYTTQKNNIMGKGDQKSKRGKITIGSYGVRRPRKAAKKVLAAPVVDKKVEKPEVAPEVKEVKEAKEVKVAAPKRKPKATETH